jgi:hypothetical protein
MTGAVPRAAERILRLVFAALAAHIVSGTIWALVGWFHPVPTLVLTGALVFLSLRLWPRPAPSTIRAGRGATLAAVAALAVVVGATVVNLANSSEHLIVDRDPGAYLTQAWWLAEHGDPRPDGLEGPFAQLDREVEVSASGPGYYDSDPGEALELQFFRGLPVLLATAGWLGRGAMLATPALLGGLGLAGVWWCAARLLRPWTAVAVLAALAVSLPQLWFSRDAFTEPLTQGLLFAALATAVRAFDDPRHAGPAGWLLGITVIMRIDALLFLAGAAAVLVADHLWGDGRAGERTRRFALGAAAPVAVGAADAITLAREYVVALGPEVAGAAGLVGLASVGGALVVVAHRQWPGTGRWIAARRRTIATVLSAATVVTAGALWFVRPLVGEATQESRFAAGRALVEFLQRAEGSEISPHRTYSEAAFERIASYLGPVTIVAATIGVAVLVYLVIARLRHAHWLPLVLVTAGPGAVYLWRSGIAPDQIWALRRFLPATIPAILLTAGFAVDQLWPAHARTTRFRALRRTGAVALAASIVAGPVAASAPAFLVEHGVGQERAVTETCETVGDDAALLFLDNGGRLRDPTMPTLRVLCDVPVAIVQTGEVSAERVRGLAREWDTEGRTLWLVAARQEDLPGEMADGAFAVFDATFTTLEQTLEGRPSEEIVARVHRFGLPVPTV